jgi:glycine/D-amino acid oxidase-like deaminating enzyme
MGITFSAFNIALRAFPGVVSVYASVLRRISLSPGLPVANPTIPLWTKNRTLPDIPVSDDLPSRADVVIIGSGITGAAIAHTLLTRSEEFQTIVMLDSRSICGGATSRNGGHCKGETWGDYAHLRKKYGEEAAQRIQKFRRTSLKDLLEIDRDYCNGKGDARQVETLDGFYTAEGWEEAKEDLEIWREAMGETGEREKYTHEIWEGEEAQQVSIL